MPEPFAETPSQEIERKLSLKEKASQKVDLTVENITAFVGWAREHWIKFFLLLAFLGWNIALITANLDGLIGLFEKIGKAIAKFSGIGGS